VVPFFPPHGVLVFYSVTTSLKYDALLWWVAEHCNLSVWFYKLYVFFEEFMSPLLNSVCCTSGFADDQLEQLEPFQLSNF